MGPIDRASWHPSWTKIGPNTYRQPYGFQEVLYDAISVPTESPGLFLVGSAVTFKYSSPDAEGNASPFELLPLLRNAWLQMRQQYPTLAAENTKDGKVYISPASRAELDAWLDSTFLVAPNKTWPELWRNLVRTSEHHTVDGRGGMNFWDRFFRALASPDPDALLTQTTGAEVARLPPRSDDLLDMIETSPGRGEQRARELLAPLSNMEAPISFPMPSPLPPHSLHNATAELKADVDTSKTIKTACKAHGISITAAWHAAVVLATQSIQAREAKSAGPGKQFACFGNFDLRRYFPDPNTVLPSAAVPDAYNLSNHHCILPCVVEPENKTLPELARELDQFYQRDLPIADPDVWSALGPMIRMMLPDYTTDPEQLGSTPALSSFGVADRFIGGEHGPWKIEDIWFGNTVTGPWLECFMWSWKGSLCLNTCFNPAYYTMDEVQGFHGAVLGEMLKGVDVDVMRQSLTSSMATAPKVPTPKLQYLHPSSGPAAILDALRADGAVIIKSLFSVDQIRRLNNDVQPAMDKLTTGSKQPDEWLQDFHGDNTKRLNGVVGIRPTFRGEILESELIHALCESIYLKDAGGYWLNSAQVIDIGPGSKAQPLHRDQWQFPIFTHCGPDAPEASVNFVVALSKFCDHNGATRVIPGSHRWSDLSDNGTPEMTIPAVMDVGDACFITGKVVHGGGANVTKHETRRAITLVFQCSYLTPEEAYPFLVDKEVVRGMSPRAQRMIGFRSQFLKNSPGVWKRNYGEVDEVYC